MRCIGVKQRKMTTKDEKRRGMFWGIKNRASKGGRVSPLREHESRFKKVVLPYVQGDYNSEVSTVVWVYPLYGRIGNPMNGRAGNGVGIFADATWGRNHPKKAADAKTRGVPYRDSINLKGYKPEEVKEGDIVSYAQSYRTMLPKIVSVLPHETKGLASFGREDFKVAKDFYDREKKLLAKESKKMPIVCGCAVCNEPDYLWYTSDKEWKRVIPPELQKGRVCYKCFRKMGGKSIKRFAREMKR
jgi:hypothetical protein